MTTPEEYLKDVYYNPLSASSYSGFGKVWQQVEKDKRPFKLTKEKVKEWLENQETYNIHTKPKTWSKISPT